MAQDGQTVDLDSLQAQIDLSMSITEQLVSSWISASPKIANGTTPSRPGAVEIRAAGPSKLRTHEKLEKELEEYMRRPPRLGVGAPIPESSVATASREAARLKHKLGVTTGTKRKRDDDDTRQSKPTISTNINGVASNSTSGIKVTLVVDKASARSHDSGPSDDDREERKGATDRAAGKRTKMLKTRLDPFAVGSRSNGKGKERGVARVSDSGNLPGLNNSSVSKNERGEGRPVGENDPDKVAPRPVQSKGGEAKDVAMDIDEVAQDSIIRSSASPTAVDYAKYEGRNRDPSNTNINQTSGDLSSARNFSTIGMQYPFPTASLKVSAEQAPISSTVTFPPRSTIPTSTIEYDTSQSNGKTYVDAPSDKNYITTPSAEDRQHGSASEMSQDRANAIKNSQSKEELNAKAAVGTNISPAFHHVEGELSSEALLPANSPAQPSSSAESKSKKKKRKKSRKTDNAVTTATSAGPSITNGLPSKTESIVHFEQSSDSTTSGEAGAIQSTVVDSVGLRNPSTANSHTNNAINNDDVPQAKTHFSKNIASSDFRGPVAGTYSTVTLDPQSRIVNDNITAPDPDKHENVVAGNNESSKEQGSVIGTGSASPTTPRHVDQEERSSERGEQSRKQKKNRREKNGGPSRVNHGPRLSDEGMAAAAGAHAGNWNESLDDDAVEEWTGFGNEDEYELEEAPTARVTPPISAVPKSLHSLKTMGSQHRRDQDLPELRLPLLNLHGPPPGSDDGVEGNEPAVAASAAADGSPKRKNRRRRKKKGKDIGRDSNEVEDGR